MPLAPRSSGRGVGVRAQKRGNCPYVSLSISQTIKIIRKVRKTSAALSPAHQLSAGAPLGRKSLGAAVVAAGFLCADADGLAAEGFALSAGGALSVRPRSGKMSL